MQVRTDLCAMLIVLSMTIGACVSDESTSDSTADGYGNMSVPLTGVSNTGKVYRLMDGDFAITGDETNLVISSNDYMGEETAYIDIGSGDYSVELLAGWSIHREEPDGTYVPVEATLTSENPVSATIEAESTTPVVFVFQAGDEIINIGDGTMAISIEINDDDTSPAEFTVSSSLSDTIGTVGIVTWDIDQDIDSATIEFGPAGSAPIYSAPVDLTAPSYRTLLLGMKASSTYEFHIVAEGNGGNGETYVSETYVIVTDALPLGLPLVTVQDYQPAAVQPGFILTCEFGDSTAFILDGDGDIVWWYQNTLFQDCSRMRMSYDGASMWLGNGNMPGPSNGALIRIAMDGTELQSITVPYRHHDFVVLEDETVATIEYEGGNTAGCDVITQINPATGQSSSILSMADYVNETDCLGNAITYNPGHALLTVGDRNAGSVLAFDLSGNVHWILGGSTSTYPVSSWDTQDGHQLLNNGNVLMFTGGSGFGGSATVHEYALSSSSAELVWEYTSDESSMSLGDVQSLANGNTLVSYANAGVMHEVDATGALVRVLDLDNALGYVVHRPTLYGPPPAYL